MPASPATPPPKLTEDKDEQKELSDNYNSKPPPPAYGVDSMQSDNDDAEGNEDHAAVDSTVKIEFGDDGPPIPSKL